jgi:hypothetical protein
VASQYIAQTPSAYGFHLLIKGLLESGVTRANRFCDSSVSGAPGKQHLPHSKPTSASHGHWRLVEIRNDLQIGDHCSGENIIQINYARWS